MCEIQTLFENFTDTLNKCEKMCYNKEAIILVFFAVIAERLDFMSTGSSSGKNGSRPQKKPVKRVEKVILSAPAPSGKGKNNVSGSKKSGSQQGGQKVSAVRRIGRGVSKTIAVTFLILMIMICIVGTAMTVFIMKYVESDSVINLDDLSLNYTTIIYAIDSDGEYTEMQTISAEGTRIWVSIDDIPQYVQDAFVYSEDERFMQHTGVDWIRTVGAFVDMIAGQLGFDNTGFGASTITQQLIKNINGDYYNRTASTKMQEIVAALNLERHYSKEQILEAYLNCINLGNGCYGVEAASQKYFGKSVSELTYTEAAALAVTTKSPSTLNPLDNPDGNKTRRNQVALSKMLEFGTITQEEYDACIEEDLTIVDAELESGSSTGIYNWYTDEVIRQVQEDLMEEYGYDSDEALSLITSGGYRIYTNCDYTMQTQLEAAFLNDSNFGSSMTNSAGEKPSAAIVVMDYSGNVKAVVGDRYEKTGSLVWSNATQGLISPGSCMKPITVYAPAIESDLITYSSVLIDEPIEARNDDGELVEWPKNYNNVWTYQSYTMAQALWESKNTIPAQLIQMLTPQYCYDFLTQKLGISTLAEDEASHEALALGGLTYGVSVEELTAAYQIFGNGGVYNEPKYYTTVLNAQGEVVLDTSDQEGTQVISSQTSYIMNRMLKNVVERGTGTAAKVSGVEVVGKTGTSSYSEDLCFVGLSPSYVAGVWLGYSENKETISGGYSAAQVWKNLMSSIVAGAETTFEMDTTGVVESYYDPSTGKCTSSNTGYIGYYKEDHLEE